MQEVQGKQTKCTMQIKGKSNKDTRPDSLLPPPNGRENCEGQETIAVRKHCYHIHVEESPGGTQSKEKQACCAGKTLPRKSSHRNPEPQRVWSTEVRNSFYRTRKLYPGKPKASTWLRLPGFSRARSLFIFISFIVAYRVCAGAVPAVQSYSEITQKLQRVQVEALKAVNVVKDINNISAKYEGKLIHVSGPISVATPVTYAECGICVRSIKLKRTSKLDKSDMFTRYEGQPYFKSSRWFNVRLGSDGFCESSSIQDDEKIADQARIGSVVLGRRLKEKFDEYYVVAEKLQLMGKTTAFPVLYSDAGRNGQIYSVMGQLVNGTIQPYEVLDYYTIILQRESKVSAERMIVDRISGRIEKLYMNNFGNYILIVIVISVPLASFLRGLQLAIRKHKKNKRKPVMLRMPLESLV